MLSELLITGFLNLSMASVLTGIPAFDASAKECAAFIGNNFSSFREEMRAARKDFSLFSASSIEDSYPVFVCEDGRDAYFLDFDDDNGYALVGQGRELLDFSPSGSLKKPSGSYPIYSRYEGFLNKNQVNALETNRNNSEKNDNGKNDLCGVSTTLQISDIDSYVLSHYGTGYSLEEIVNKYGWTYRVQSDFSVYRKRVGSGIYEYEDNCLLASLYEACDFYRSAVQVTAFPSTLVSSNAQGDSFYSSLINQVDSTGTPIFTIFHSSIPAVYRTIREWYKNNDSYQLGPAHLSKALNCISNLGLDFGINLSGNLLTTFSLQDVLSTLDSNLVSTIFCESISGLLHAMPVTGKRIYSKTSGWWIFQHKDYLNFIGVNDNYSDQQHFLDYTAGLTGSLLRITLSL